MNNKDAYDNRELSIRERIKQGWIPTDIDFRKMSVAELTEAQDALQEGYLRDIEELLQIGRDAGINFAEDQRRKEARTLTAGSYDKKTDSWTAEDPYEKARIAADEAEENPHATNQWDHKKKRWVKK